MNKKKIEELENTIKQAQKQIEELKKEDETPMFKYPRIGQTVWFINEYGNIDWVVWTDTEIGKNMVHLGMIFFTKEEAEFERERRKVIAELKLFEEPEGREWDMNNVHYCLCYSYIDNDIGHEVEQCFRADNIYFASKEDMQRAVDFVGEDRVKRYYLMVKD